MKRELSFRLSREISYDLKSGNNLGFDKKKVQRQASKKDPTLHQGEPTLCGDFKMKKTQHPPL